MNFYHKFKTKLTSLFLIPYSLILFFPNLSYATNLQDAVKTAEINNRNIKLERIKLKATKTSKAEAIAEFLPNVSANAQYGNKNEAFKGQTSDPSTKQRVREIKIDQPLFDGFHSISKYREANYKIKSASSKTSDKIQEISFAAVQSYCNLFRYSELVKLQKDSKDLAKKFMDLVQRRKDVQIIDKSEIIKFGYEASINDEKYFDILSKLNKAKFDYQNVVGELHQNLTLPVINEENFDQEKIVAAVLEGNNSIKSSQYNYLASKAAYNAEKSNFSPKLSLSAAASRQDRVVYLNNQDLNSKSVFLNLSIPIFQRGTEYASLSRAGYEKEAALEEYEIAKESIVKEVSQTLEEYHFFSQMNKANKKLFEMAKSREEVFNKRLKSKVEDPIEVIRAKIETNERKINYIESQINLVITYYKIKYFLSEI
ncbi:MAG: TolC family protein [Pseudomonadota bacterium]